MILLRSVSAQASGSLVGANLAPVSHTSEEEEDDGSALLSRGGGRLDRYVCRSGPESDGDGIYGDMCTSCGIRSVSLKGFVSFILEVVPQKRN